MCAAVAAAAAAASSAAVRSDGNHTAAPSQQQQQQPLRDSFGNVPYTRLFDDKGDDVATAAALRAQRAQTRYYYECHDAAHHHNNDNDDNDNEDDKNTARIGHTLRPPRLLPGALTHIVASAHVPHELRAVGECDLCDYVGFVFAAQFWTMVQYAARVTLIGMLPPAVLVHVDMSHRPFVSDAFAMLAVVVASGTHVGQTIFFLVQLAKATCLWLPLSIACTALHLHRHLAVWFVVYVVVIFALAVFTEGATRRMALLLYNVCMVDMLSARNTTLLYPVRLLADWCVGAGFALLATLLPYPLLACRSCDSATHRLFAHTHECVDDVVHSFWASSNTERAMRMARVRARMRQAEHLFAHLATREALALYELIVFDSRERRDVRACKARLLQRVYMDLRTLRRVVTLLQSRPQLLDHSARCVLLRRHLAQPVARVTACLQRLLQRVGVAHTYAALHRVDDDFDACARAVRALQDEFDVARRVLLYEAPSAAGLARRPRQATAPTTRRTAAAAAAGSMMTMRDARHGAHHASGNNNNGDNTDRMQELMPLITFFVFGVVNVCASLREFQLAVAPRHRERRLRARCLRMLRVLAHAALQPLRESAWLVYLLAARRGKPEVRVVIEAAKVTLAMFIAVVFFYYYGHDRRLLLSGPMIIAFISGTNPVEAVQASTARLIGTMLGSVVGFFASTVSDTPADRILAVCLTTFFLTLPRRAHSVGLICTFCNFIVLSSLGRRRQGEHDALNRIQQNTFAVLIYCAIVLTVYPLSPRRVLMQKRMTIVYGICEGVRGIMQLLRDAAREYEALATRTRDTSAHAQSSATAPHAAAAAAVTSARASPPPQPLPQQSPSSLSLQASSSAAHARTTTTAAAVADNAAATAAAAATNTPHNNNNAATVAQQQQPLVPVRFTDDNKSNTTGGGGGHRGAGNAHHIASNEEPLYRFPTAGTNLNAPPAQRRTAVYHAPGHGGDNNNNSHNNNNSNNNNNSGSAAMRDEDALLPMTFTQPQEDKPVSRLFALVTTMLRWLRDCEFVAPLAADEVRVLPTSYPVRASSDVHAALSRQCVLIYSMTCSWQRMRARGYFTWPVAHVLHNMSPLAGDVAACASALAPLLARYVRDPSPTLAMTVTQRVMQLRVLCAELRVRNERDLHTVRRRTAQAAVTASLSAAAARRARGRQQQHEPHQDDDSATTSATRAVQLFTCASTLSQSSSNDDVDNADDDDVTAATTASVQRATSRYSRAAAGPSAASPSSTSPTTSSSAATLRAHAAQLRAALQRLVCTRRPGTQRHDTPRRDDNNNDDSTSAGSHGSDSAPSWSLHSGDGSMSSDDGVATLHDSSAQARSSNSSSNNDNDNSSSLTAADSDDSAARCVPLVHYGRHFIAPVSTVEAEGLHSFTLALEMLSKEMRQMLYSLEEIVQSDQSVQRH